MEGVRIFIANGPEIKARLGAVPLRLNRAMQAAMQKSVDVVQRRIAMNLTGQVLHVQTGRLRQSFLQPANISADGSMAQFGSNVEYARIHEYGGTTRPHEIWAKRTKYLRFGAPPYVFRKMVNHPGSVMPPRPYARPALRASTEDIREIFRAGLAAELAKT